MNNLIRKKVLTPNPTSVIIQEITFVSFSVQISSKKRMEGGTNVKEKIKPKLM